MSVPAQAGEQQVSAQCPFSHIWPGLQVMPEQGLATQAPLTQTWLLVHPPLQGSTGVQLMVQVVPAPQGALQGCNGWHVSAPTGQ